MQLIFVSLFVSCEKEEYDTTYSLSEYEQDVFDLINEHRTSIGKEKLIVHPYITESAREHSTNMATGKTDFGHDGFFDRVADIKKKLEISGRSAENVAYNYSSAAQSVVDQWLKSPGHKKNLEGAYTISGVGIAKSEEGVYYYTQIFINY